MTALTATLLAVVPSCLLAANNASNAKHEETVSTYCFECHNFSDFEGGLALDLLDINDIGSEAETWEKVANKLRGSFMPPVGQPRPDKQTYNGFADWVEDELDQAARENPNPGRPGLYRLNRTEYATVIKDVLGLDIDIAAMLPADNSSYGFDNIADLLGVSSTLLEGYLAAADRVSAVAVGDPGFAPESITYRVPSALSQDDHIDGLPLGTRGGVAIEHNFPLDAIYEINPTFIGNSVDAIRGLQFPHQFEIALDGKRIRLVTIGGTGDHNLMMENSAASKRVIEGRTKVRVPVTAGVHTLTLTFISKTGALEMGHLQPYDVINFDPVDLAGISAVNTVEIRGPFNGQAPGGSTRSRAALFSCYPGSVSEEERCAEEILTKVARKAYRRPLLDEDITILVDFFRAGREDQGSFDGGIQLAVRRMLMSVNFLFRVEADPIGIAPGEAFEISDMELASRLSFFLWSSVPDEELIEIASRGRLRNPEVLEQQVNRMLADPRSQSLVSNFAGQWLQLRNLASSSPDQLAFPNFDENLRNAFFSETSLFFESVMKEDRNVLDLMTADYTFLNERLAAHYGIPDVYGDEFRRVELNDATRGGILTHGSILTVTSFAHRTSPVLRGKWVLDNIMGSRVPEAPDNVPALDENAADAIDVLTVRERLAKHRDNPACASCHNVMDPIGFAMEKYDAIGRWRLVDEGGEAIDSTGKMSSGAEVTGPADLKLALLERPEQFVETFSAKMLTYAIGRGLEYYDMPVVRSIVDETADQDYRFSAIVMEIVQSLPFQMKNAIEPSVSSEIQMASTED